MHSATADTTLHGASVMRVAVWGHPYAEFPAGCDSVAEIAERLAALREAGIDLYFPFVAVTGEHFFESEVLGRPARDLLGPFLEAARQVGMAVHPILGLGGPLGLGQQTYEPPAEAAGVPQYVLHWACASWGENHERAVLVANEIIEHYRPEGIHLDYARFPNAEVLARYPCACARCKEARLHWLGKPIPEPQDLLKPGVVYRELQMRSEFVRAFVESMRGLTDHHGVELSASVRPRYYEDALAEGQDWADWCADGLIDVCCPMSYTESFGTFALWMARHLRLTGNGDVQWLAGIGVDSPEARLNAEQMARQARFARSAGADGVALFSAGTLDAEQLASVREVSGL